MALPMVTQAQLVDELADSTGFQKGEIKHMLTALEEILREHLKECERVKIANVTVEPRLRKAKKRRQVRNPATSEMIWKDKEPASVKIVAKVAKPLQESAPSAMKLRKRL